MFFTIEKLDRNIRKLDGLRYRDRREIDCFRMSALEEGPVGKRPDAAAYVTEFRKGEFWSGRGDYVWICREVEIPREWTKGKIAGLFRFGKTGDGYNSGFEALLYVDGVPYQGVGSYHEEVIFPKECAGKTLELAFRLWAGLEGGGMPQIQTHQFQQAELCLLDETADDLYYTSRAVAETISVLAETDPVRGELLTALDRAHGKIDWRMQGSGQFYESLGEALEVLKKGLGQIAYTSPVTVHTIGHSHIDVAWLWQLKHTREKAARTFSTMCTLMEQYPEFTFLQSQPQLYQYIKKDYPDIYERMKKAVKAGQWEPNGGMWLEADCNIVSGESLVRQLLNGRDFFQKEFGITSNVLWLPDVFGYSWALPQILKKSGIDTFMTIKISWNQYNQMPHDTFRWRGIDGSEVLTHFMTTPAVADSGAYTYNGKIDPVSVQGAWKLYHDKEINQDLLLAYGYGDGGGGVNREMLEMGRRLQSMPGLPRVIPGRADAYFNRLKETVEETDRFVHTWDGELYLEYHRGTYTSQAKNKKQNRKLELKLRELEWLAAEAAVRNQDFGAYPGEKFKEAWEILLRNQFHDIIPGSSIHEVYEDSEKEHQEAWEILGEIEADALKDLRNPDEGRQVTVVNSSSFPCSELVFIPGEGTEKGHWYQEDGTMLESVRYETGWLTAIPDAAPTSLLKLTFREDALEPERPQTVSWESAVETPFYRIAWNEKGQICSLYDKEQAREVLEPGACGNRLVVYEDRPLCFDAWDIDLFYQEKAYEVEDLRKVRVERSSLMTEVHFCWKYQNSTIWQKARLYRDNRRIDFVTRVDWQEHQQLLRVLFPVDIRSTEAVFDIQYGNVKRPTHQNTSWDMAKFETVGHQWADLSETGYGVSLMNDCKYGYNAKKNVLGLSLIKSGTNPDYNADQGNHTFTYALYPHGGSWQQAKVPQAAWHLNNPLRAVPGSIGAKNSFIRADAENVMIDCVKKAEYTEDLIVRVHEYEGRRAKVTLSPGFELNGWQETDLMENVVGEVQTGELTFVIRPYEIRTFKISGKAVQR
ncbi:MAG: alpha-mannosidase [Eubacteriales bacterium]|nr:alpha-mannosidase [Eubacteriales bacterium]